MDFKNYLSNDSSIIVANSHEDWLRDRKSFIGSSDIATIVGCNKFDTPYQLYLRKKGEKEEKEETFEMHMGHLLEPVVSRLFSEETGLEILQESEQEFIVRNINYPDFSASPDRFYLDNGELCILECKTTQMKIDQYDLPKYWQCQLQWQLGLCGLKKGCLAWLISGHLFGFQEIDFDPDFFRYLCECGGEFVDKYLKGNEVPSKNNTELIDEYSKKSNGSSIEATEEILETLSELTKLKSVLKENESTKKNLEDEIKLFMKDNEILTSSDQVICTWKRVSSGKRFDSAAFVKANPELAKEYYKMDEHRRFLLK